MSDQAVQYTPLGASVSHAKATKETPRHRGTLFPFTHRTRYTQPSAQQLARIRSARLRRRPDGIREQQQRLGAALIAAATKIPKENPVATQLQVNVCEWVFSGLTPKTCWTYMAVIAAATGRNLKQVEVWFSNNRENRTKYGRQRVTQDIQTLFQERTLGVYPDKVKNVQDMSLERFVQMVEAERDRQTILLGLKGFEYGNAAIKEQAGTQPTKDHT